MATSSGQQMFAGGDWGPSTTGETLTPPGEAHRPFGGRAGSDSGIGRVGGAHLMHSFTELQTIVITPHPQRD